jgi:hypothetical protein
MPVPDQVRDDGSGIQNVLISLDSGYRIVSGTGLAGMTLTRKNWLFMSMSRLRNKHFMN